MKKYFSTLALSLALAISAVTTPPASAEPMYTAAEVHLHNKATDCWTIVSTAVIGGDRGVYNLTSFIAAHEGGRAAIIGMCGVDATVGFLAQHQGEQEPTRTLAAYRIGVLDPTTPPPPTTVYTVMDVRAHSVAADCWSAVGGGVYDLTGWIAVHPGGSAVVVGMCGIDATATFMAQHSADLNPLAILEQFKIGIFDPTPPPADKMYTLAQVASHNIAADCWSAVSGNVYDLTTWVNSHPGGPAVITAMCGKDGTSAFLGYHGAATNPNNVLGQFRIGILDNGNPPPPETKYTMTQVAAHNTAADCWSVVSNTVYNLTAWVNLHPGGPALITAMCGKDGTSAFVGYHGAATNPNSVLGTYKIGILDNGNPPPLETKYTLAQVSVHNKQTDCWTIVSGNVYNITSFINAHPGGVAFISAMCGLDGTSFYLGQHSSSATALATLANFKIGVLDITVLPPTTKEYTLAQVAAHNKASDCWTIVDKFVYDVTQWIPLHPGGQAQIKAMCGVNATAAFSTQHSGSASAKASLAAYKIGNFKATAVVTKYYTLAQVRQHASRTNCWTVVLGKVYNLTKWIASHPGGSEAIIEMCGRNGTSDFLEGHSGDKAAAAQLASFKIGLLKTSGTAPTPAKSYTLAQVATHKTASNCWSIVGSSVYNLTKWIPLHPGGQAQIKAMCGKDATAGFSGQHSGSTSAKASLAKYKIGSYKKTTTAPVVLKNYTAKQVATHSTASNCWSIVSKKVYNLTQWIALHPGGQAQIKAMCGKDATAGFNGQHSGSTSAAASLAKYRIGTLVASSTPPAPTVTTYTLTQIKAHSTASNCWTAANGMVYSLTAWLRKQPAGSVDVKAICGKNSTTALKAKFGSLAKIGTELSVYKIGKLK